MQNKPCYRVKKPGQVLAMNLMGSANVPKKGN